MDEPRAALSRIATVAVPAAFLAMFFVWPLAAIVDRGLSGAGEVELPVDVLWFTVWQAALSTVLTMLAGLPLAWALARFSFPGRSVVAALVLVPFVLPTIVVATAFLALLPDSIEQSLTAIFLAHVFFNVAVVVRIVGGYWAGLDDRLWEAAAALGASPFRRLRSVTLPVLAPALAASASIVFLFCFTSFGVIVVLGGPGRSTLETEIYNQAARFFDLRTASVLALLQLGGVALVVVVAGHLERRLAHAPNRDRVEIRPTGRARVAVAAIVAVSTALLLLPLLALVRASLTVPGGIGLDHFAALGEETSALLVTPWHAIVNSLAYALLATVIAVAVGVPASLAIARGRGALDTVLMLPLGASAVMLGFGFILAFDDPPLELRGSYVLVPIAQSLVAIPFVVRSLVPAILALDDRLHEAAAVLGASPAMIRRMIDLPLLARALGVATGLAFAVALGEFGATVFLARADRPTLPVAIFTFLGRPGADNVGTAMALCVVLMGLIIACALVGERVFGRRPAR